MRWFTFGNFQMTNKSIESTKAPEPVGNYPHARVVGELLFLSGVGPRARGTKIIPGVDLDDNGNIISYDIEKQCRSVFNNIKYSDFKQDKSQPRI